MISRNILLAFLPFLAANNSIAQHGRIIKNVPVLCYHHIALSAEGHSADYTCHKATFEKHLKILSDSNYHSISPEQLYNYLNGNGQLPDKPFLITFDDGHEEHFTIVDPLLEQYNFTATFFIPTRYIGKKRYLNKDQIRALAEKGHTIGAHSFDHPDFRYLDTGEWNKQLIEPVQLLEHITNKKTHYFAYPFGAWNDNTILHLKQAGIKAAFQLGGKRSNDFPLYTIKRFLVSGNWSPQQLIRQMNTVSRPSQ